MSVPDGTVEHDQRARRRDRVDDGAHGVQMFVALRTRDESGGTVLTGERVNRVDEAQKRKAAFVRRLIDVQALSVGMWVHRPRKPAERRNRTLR